MTSSEHYCVANANTIPLAARCTQLSISTRQGKSVLKNVNVDFPCGSITVILGASGTGKTALLRAAASLPLRGLRITSGKVEYFDSTQKGAGSKNISTRKCEFVATAAAPLPSGLTVRETLEVAAQLRQPCLSACQREQCVNQALRSLLLSTCENTLIGSSWAKGISTGELVRVKIASALLSNPTILIIDEPVTGLDSSLAAIVFRLLWRLTATTKCAVVISGGQISPPLWHQMVEPANNIVRLCILTRDGTLQHLGDAVAVRDSFAGRGSTPEFLWQLVQSEEKPGFSALKIQSDSCQQFGGNEPSGLNPCNNCNSDSSQDKRLISTLETPTQTPTRSHNRNDLRCFGESKYEETCEKACAWLTWSQVLAALSRRHFFSKFRLRGEWLTFFAAQVVAAVFLSAFFAPSIVMSQDSDRGVLSQIEGFLEKHKSAVEIFASGIDGNQFVLDALELGVDGKGSQPLLDVFRNQRRRLQTAQNAALCASQRVHIEEELSNFGYVDYGRQTFGHSFVGRALNVSGNIALYDLAPLNYGATVVGIMGVLQVFDFTISKLDWAAPTAELKAYSDKTGETDKFWTALSGYIARTGLNPLAQCFGYPKYPLDNWAANPEESSDVFLSDDEDIWGDTRRQLSGVDNVISGTKLLCNMGRHCDRRAILHVNKNSSSFTYRELIPKTEPSFDDTFSLGTKRYFGKAASRRVLQRAKEGSDPRLERKREKQVHWIPQAFRDVILASGLNQESFRKMANVGKDLFDRISARKSLGNGDPTCSHRVCRKIDEMRSNLETFSVDVVSRASTLVNIEALLFLFIAALGFTCFSAAVLIPQQITLYREETENKLYGPITFIMSQTAASVPFVVIPPIIASLILVLALNLFPRNVSFDWQLGPILEVKDYVAAEAIIGEPSSMNRAIESSLVRGEPYMPSSQIDALPVIGMVQLFTYLAKFCFVSVGVTAACWSMGELVGSILPIALSPLALSVAQVINLTTSGFFVRGDQLPVWAAPFGILGPYRWAFGAIMTNQFPINSPSFDTSFGVEHGLTLFSAGITCREFWTNLGNLWFMVVAYKSLLAFALYFMADPPSWRNKKHS